MLATTPSSEISEWIAEYILRNREEEEAIEKAREEAKGP